MILFRNSDLKALEQDLGGPSWFNQIVETAMMGTIPFETFEKLLERGLKDAARQPLRIDIDDLQTPFHDDTQTIIDALCVSLKGKGFETYIKEVMAAYETQQEDGSPLSLSPDTTTSTTSDADASGPESE